MTDLEKIRLQMKLQQMLLNKLEHELSDSQLLNIMEEITELIKNFESY